MFKISIFKVRLIKALYTKVTRSPCKLPTDVQKVSSFITFTKIALIIPIFIG